MVRSMTRSKLLPVGLLGVLLVGLLAWAAVQNIGSVRLLGTAGTGPNVAMGKPASQSSTYSHVCSPHAGKAVDGNANGVFYPICSTTHTNNEYQPWWQVDLGSSYIINSAMLYNRTDCCGDRLSNFKVQVSADGAGWTDIHAQGYAAQSVLYIGGSNLRARYVRVQLQGTGVLSLTEVAVYGTPDNLAPSLTIAPPPHYPPGTTSDLYWGLTYRINGNADLQNWFCGWIDIGSGTTRSNCTPTINRGDTIRVTAPLGHRGYKLTGWTNCPGTVEAGTNCLFTVPADPSVPAAMRAEASFQWMGTATLTLRPGSWQIVTAPYNLTCWASSNPGGCTMIVARGDTVQVQSLHELIGRNTARSIMTAWTEDCAGTQVLSTPQSPPQSEICALVMDRDRSVNATYSVIPR